MNRANATRVEAIDPAVETSFWRSVYVWLPYRRADRPFDDFEPAYRLGWEAAVSSEPETTFEDLESDLAHAWPAVRGSSRLAWAEAREAVRDSWERVRRRSKDTTATTVPSRTSRRR